MVNYSYSLFIVSHVGNTFQSMFPASTIAPSFSLSKTCASYKISRDIAPYFKKTFVEDLVKLNLPLNMYFDETSKAQVKNRVDLILRYWSPTHNKVWIHLCTSLCQYVLHIKNTFKHFTFTIQTIFSDIILHVNKSILSSTII